MNTDQLREFMTHGQAAQAAVDTITANHVAGGLVVVQGTDEWRMLRLGKVTASRIADVMAKPRVPGEGMRANYLWQLVCERMSGVPMKTYQSKTMEEAHEWEPLARASYAFRSDNRVTEVAFVDHPDIPMCGCSPDGLVENDFELDTGMVQIKCPELAAHGRMLLSHVEIPGNYMKQMQWEMACTGRRWCDFVSFNADFPEAKNTVIRRVERNSAMIEEIATAVRSFQTEIDLTLSALK